MPDKVYVSQAGFVQFDPVEREANGKKLVEVTIKAIGKPVNIRITIWPELKEAWDLVTKGDFVAVEGTFTSSTYQSADGSSKTSYQISAFGLNVNGKRIERVETERGVVSSDSGESDSSDLPF